MEPVRYLSDEWLRLADRQLNGFTPVSEPVSVGVRVRSGPEGDRHYRLILGPDRVGVDVGDDGCGVTMTLDWDTAVAIAQGVSSAQRAFLDGNVQLGGDASLLLGHQQELAEIDDRLGELRAATVFS
jgi:hypothetical protein